MTTNGLSNTISRSRKRIFQTIILRRVHGNLHLSRFREHANRVVTSSISTVLFRHVRGNQCTRRFQISEETTRANQTTRYLFGSFRVFRRGEPPGGFVCLCLSVCWLGGGPTLLTVTNFILYQRNARLGWIICNLFRSQNLHHVRKVVSPLPFFTTYSRLNLTGGLRIVKRHQLKRIRIFRRCANATFPLPRRQRGTRTLLVARNLGGTSHFPFIRRSTSFRVRICRSVIEMWHAR